MAIRYVGGPIQAMATGARVATGAASANGTLPTDNSGSNPRYILLTATAACHFRLGKTADTPVAVNTDLMIQPGDAVVLAVPSGYTKYAHIQDAAAGVLQIQPLDNA